MQDNRTYLKVKIKSLAEEAKIIRKEERKPHKDMDEYGYSAERMGLMCHRTGTVRNEARHTLLAYGFIRGRKYRQMEAKCEYEPDWKKVWRMVEKHGVQRQWFWRVDSETRQAYKKRRLEQERRFKEWSEGKWEPTRKVEASVFQEPKEKPKRSVLRALFS